MLLDALAAVVERYAYDAFGKTQSGAGLTLADPASTTWLFAGDGQYDPANGLTNHIARWRQGHRFLSLDPFAGHINDPLSLHKYLYAHGNPVSFVDPTGLFSGGLIGLGAANSIGSALNSIQGETGARVAEIAFLAAQGATAASALISVLAFDVAGLGIPVLGDAFGNLVGVFFSRSTNAIGRILPRATNGTRLVPGVMHISDSQINALFRKGAGSAGNKLALRSRYAEAVGLSVSSLEGINAQFHHIIPVQVARDSALLKKLSFQVDNALNALPLKSTRHAGSHPNYNRAIEKIMMRINSLGGNNASKRELVLATITNATTTILEGETLRKSSLSIQEWVDRISPI